MSALLRLAALVSLAWALLLLGFKDYLLRSDQLTALVRALANGLGLAYVAFAYLFWMAARNPAANRGAIYCAIVLSALKTANDLYGLLVVLPPETALIGLGDLVLSVGLVVGLLEALPRLLSGQAKK